MPEEPRVTERPNWLLFAGLLGLAVTGVFQLLGKEALDLPLTIGLFCFAVGVPMLAANLIVEIARPLRAGQAIPHKRMVFALLGVAASLVGLVACVAHMNLIAGAVFAVASVVSILLIKYL